MEAKLLGLLGFARRAGKITSGFDASMREVASGKARVVIITSDASPNTSEKMLQACLNYDVPAVTIHSTMDDVGRAIGKASTAVAAITDRSFAKRVMTLSLETDNLPGN
jgi:ribosomal protein L7Ae-like RNA K-turn-binding protein